jgi:hypothetical protein
MPVIIPARGIVIPLTKNALQDREAVGIGSQGAYLRSLFSKDPDPAVVTVFSDNPMILLTLIPGC